MRSARFRSRSVLRYEPLEDRSTPAQFNIPWADPTHLTVSFAPDGTAALNESNRLFAALDAQMPRATWQSAILHAVQTWADVAGVNVGQAADGGDPFGTTGLPQGDTRFGDIRIGALPMAGGELAEATPPDPTIVGTLAGDIYFNSLAAFTPDTLYGVALHEVGHALGLPSNDDPTSVMHDVFNHILTLGASDVTAVRALYGVRTADANEGATGNGTIKDATRIRFHSSFDGSTPLVIYGDVTAPGDADTFYLPVLDTYSGPMTVRLQTTGISLLTPTLTVLDKNGAVLATATGTTGAADAIRLTLPQVTAGGKYYLRVEAAGGASFAVGRYGIGVTFDGLLQPTPLSLDAVLRGPYDALSPQDIISLFKNPTGTGFNDDGGTNDTIGKATLLSTSPGFAANTRFRTTAGVSTSTDVDFYQIKAPSTSNNAAVVLTATVRAVAPNGAVQRIELYDSRQARIPATILANENGTFTVQAAGLPSNTVYYVRVGGGAAGNYQLDIGFGSKTTEQNTFSAGTIPAGGQLAAPLYIAQTQVFGFALTATGPTGSPIQMSIVDATGRVVFTLTGLAGDTVTGVTGLLAPGEYTIRMTSPGSSAPIGFTLRGTAITDPIGPQPQDSSTAPQYGDPQTPGGFLYPGGTSTLSPYLFGLWIVI